MKIQLNESNCDCVGKKICLKNCPNSLAELNALNCVHCIPKKAACALACNKNAFFEISPGILSIDESLCNGCLECAEACSKKAICLVEGKASKCDLCAKNDFMISCIENCPNNALISRQSAVDLKNVSKIMGWSVKKSGGFLKKLREGDSFEICELQDCSKSYLLKGFPELSFAEAELFEKMRDTVQKNLELRKKISLNFFLKDYCVKNLIELTEVQKSYLLEMLELEVFGLSGNPLDVLLKDENIEEIACIGVGKKSRCMFFTEFSDGFRQTFFTQAIWL